MDCEKVLKELKTAKYGGNLKIIGEIITENHTKVVLKTKIGETHIISILEGEQLPGIC